MSRKKGYSVYRAKRPDGSRESTWTVAYFDGGGKRRYVRGVSSKAIADEIGRSKSVERDRVRGGVITASEAKAKEAAGLALQKHLDRWRDDMRARGVTKGHWKIQTSRVKKLAKLAKIDTLTDLAAEPIQKALARLSSPQNAGHYYTALRAFVYWCCETGRLSHDPVAALRKPVADGKVFIRTAIDPEKLPDLLDAARTRRTDAKHPGEDRAMFYLVLAHTGLRRREAESLKPESFASLTVTVKAGYTKNGDDATLPLTRDAWELLTPWLSTKKPGRRVFDFGPHWNCEELFKGDCKAAGIVAVAGERLGVHSLRRMFITQVVRHGGLAVGQELARHSTPKLTMEYVDLHMKDYEKGLAGLPPVKQPNAQHKAQRTA